MKYSDDEDPMPYKKPAKHSHAPKGCPENGGKEHVYVNVGTKWRKFVCVCGHIPNHRTLRKLFKEDGWTTS